MDYEKKYKEALERAKSLIGDTIIEESGQHIAEVIFPELAESEDERIRKAIHIYLDWLDGRKDCQPKGDYTIKDMIAWLEKQGTESVNIDIESMVSSYGQRLKSQGQGNLENNPLINMCLSAFRCGVENTLEELNLKKLEKQGEQKPADSYCQEHWKGYQETGKCFADGDCRDKREAEQKSAWSEDNKYMIDNLIHIFKVNYPNDYYKVSCKDNSQKVSPIIYSLDIINWLKSLKQRIEDLEDIK